MRFLIVSQYFHPEEFRVNDLVETLVRKGHQVTVLTGKPNYPKGEYFAGYGYRGVVEEDYKGARVIRVPLRNRGNGNAIRMVWNYFSFVLNGNRYVRRHKLEADAIICYEVSPITQAFPGLLCKKKYGGKFLLWIQDLWPESVTAAGGVTNKFVLSVLDRMVKRIYYRSDKLMAQSNAISESILSKGDYKDKIVYVPNWAEDMFSDDSLIDNRIELPDGFVVMFAGNIGAAMDYPSVVKAADCTRDHKDIKWVIVGDGRMREEAVRMVDELGLQDTVIFLGRHPVTEMPSYFHKADVLFTSLRDEYIFSLTIPSKLQCYMAAGRPILTMLKGAGNAVVEDAGCGLTAEAGDYKGLAENVIALYSKSREEREKMGMNARKYYFEHFDKNTVVDKMIKESE